jgi:hypothetical protein
MMQIGPMPGKFEEFAFVFADLAVRGRYLRQRGRGIQPTRLTIEHTFILEISTDIDTETGPAGSGSPTD